MIAGTLDRLKTLDWKKHQLRIRAIVERRPVAVGAGTLGVLLVANLLAVSGKQETKIIERSESRGFQGGRILSDQDGTFYSGKERLLSQKAQTFIENQQRLEGKIAELEKKLESQGAGSGTTLAQTNNPAVASDASSVTQEGPIQLYPPPGNLEGATVNGASVVRPVRSRSLVGGPNLIAFPVKGDSKSEGVILPAGSYVKAKILTGVDVPEGKTYPVLMVLDFSYVAPNDHKIDLSGCFMIAKAEGDLSTERVQMQASKMSCVSKRGKMFEREINGFIADDKDGSFAMQGKVNSKQGRVASMAFLASVVDGVGKAVQAAQTTQSTNPLGGSSSVLTGDSGKYIAAGGASNAAGQVAQWYLQQAQNLAPTVSVSSGRDVWIVMKDKVSLPEEFFKKERKPGNEGIYTYFTRVLE